MNQAIHITHEAAKKIGGIGSVLSGLCTANTYLDHFQRTLFYGPLFDDKPNPSYDETIASERLGANSKVYFSTLDNITNSSYNILFNELKNKYGIDILYGEKILFDEIDPKKSNKIEILLVGVKSMKHEMINDFKYKIWETFQFSCQRYENDWDFEQYIRIAVPFQDICQNLFSSNDTSTFFSHEYMGIASCLSIFMNRNKKDKTKKIYFHAHELTTARAITESVKGHDITFYGLMNEDISNSISIEDRFGSQQHNSRSELVKLTRFFDGVLAVGDWVKKEYQYLIPEAEKKKIHVCYNGTPAPIYSFEEKLKAREKLIQYCETIYNYTPDVVMSHVTRLVVSKGLWRDLSLLEELDKKFTADKIKGFCVILSTLIGNGRTNSEIKQMEDSYGWPVLHKHGYPDLLGYENDFYWDCQHFNAKSCSIKVVYINQFGFSPERIGSRLPEGTTFADLRLASDAEFGMSIYEPFGIAQIETIPFGGIAVLSQVCGSAFLLEKAFKDEKLKPYFIFDFTKNHSIDNKEDLLNLNEEMREKIEKEIIKKQVSKVYNIIPKTEKERKKMFTICQNNMVKLSWDEVIKSMPFL